MNNLSKKYKIIKELGHGMIGTVYLVTDGKDKYAYKIQHILKGDVKKNMKSSIWREIDFSLNFANKHPLHFIKLIDYEIIKDCKHIQKYPLDINLFTKEEIEMFKQLKKSNYCILKIYDLIDSTFKKMIKKFNIKQIYSSILQLIYSIKLMHSKGYIHGDIHKENIGVNKTDIKYLKMFEHDIPSYGYLIKLIDYGSVLNKKDIANKQERYNYNLSKKYELKDIKYLFIDSKLWDYVFDNDININIDEIYEKIKETNEYNIIKKYTNDKYDQIFLFDIIYPKIYQRYVLGDNFKKLLPTKLYMPIEDFIYFVKYGNDFNKIADYFIRKLT